MTKWPKLLFAFGKKKAGKDFLVDCLVAEAGFHKYHIVYPWLVKFCERNGIAWADYENDPAVKAKWRSQIQAEATEERKNDPDVLLKAFHEAWPTLPLPLAVTGVRFMKEATLGLSYGAMLVKVEVSDEIRRQRFVDSGEDLAMFDDPFESHIDTLPFHLEVDGSWHKAMLTSSVALACEFPTRPMWPIGATDEAGSIS